MYGFTFFLVSACSSKVCINIIYLTRVMGGHLGHFQVFVITNNSTMSIPLSPYILCSFDCIYLHLWVAREFEIFIAIAKWTFKYCINLQCNYQHIRVPVSPYPQQQYGLSTFFILDSLLRERMGIIAAFISLALIINEVEHFFIYLLTFYLFFSDLTVHVFCLSF